MYIVYVVNGEQRAYGYHHAWKLKTYSKDSIETASFRSISQNRKLRIFSKNDHQRQNMLLFFCRFIRNCNELLTEILSFFHCSNNLNSIIAIHSQFGYFVIHFVIFQSILFRHLHNAQQQIPYHWYLFIVEIKKLITQSRYFHELNKNKLQNNGLRLHRQQKLLLLFEQNEVKIDLVFASRILWFLYGNISLF